MSDTFLIGAAASHIELQLHKYIRLIRQSSITYGSKEMTARLSESKMERLNHPDSEQRPPRRPGVSTRLRLRLLNLGALAHHSIVRISFRLAQIMAYIREGLTSVNFV